MNATHRPGISFRHPAPAGLRAVVRHWRPRLWAPAFQALLLLTGGTAMAAKPTVSIDDVQMLEGERKLVKSTMTFTLSLSEKASERLSVRVATTNGTANAGSDYDSASGVVRFRRGQIRQTFSVKINGDATAEQDETFFVDLSSPDGLLLGKRRGIGTILDDDTPAPEVALSVADATVSEGNGERRSLRFVVTAQPAPKSTVTVSYATANGSAKAGSDYVTTSGKLSFGAGVGSQIIEVPVIGDTVAENDETLTLTLSASTGRTRLDRAQATGTIVDDDQAAPATPNPFAFTARAHLEPGSSETSEPVQILGLATAAPISIRGGRYSVNGQPFTDVPGNIGNGDIVEVQAQTPASYGASASARLTIGTAAADFTVEVRPRDTTPEPFAFAPVFAAAAGSSVSSAPATVSGIDPGTPISVTGGAYRIDDGPWLTTPGTVSAGRQVRVMVTAGSSGSVSRAELRIGTLSAGFAATTADGNAPPRAFSFAAVQGFPLLLAESATVTVAGLAAPARVRVGNGRYSLNGGAYTTLDGVVVNGDRLRVALIAAPNLDDRQDATLTLGSYATRFSVTTSAPEDRASDAIQLPSISTAAINSAVITPPMTIRGINVAVPISVSSGLRYSLNDGPFTGAAGMVRWGDSLRLRIDTGPDYGRRYTGDVTIGSGTTSWQVRSQLSPARPARFTLSPASIYTNGLVLPGSVQTTEPVTVSDADGPQTVSASNAQYRINDGPYRSSAGTVRNGDRITLRAVMPSTYSTDQVISLSIGSTSASLTLSTTIDAVANTPTTVSGASESHVVRSDGIVPLRAFVFKPDGWRTSDRRAAYIDWSGGGWARSGVPMSRSKFWADQYGMVVIAPDQRVNDRFGTYAYVHADDARRVLKWVQDHAGELGIDPARVVVTGTSSGGGNATWAALLEPPATTAIDSSPPVRAAAVVLRSGVTSTAEDAALGRSQLARFGSFVDAISPDRDIDAGIAPFLIFHGDADVVFAQSANLRLCSRIRALGRICDFHNQAGLGHDWANDSSKLAESRSIEVDFLNRIGVLPSLR